MARDEPGRDPEAWDLVVVGAGPAGAAAALGALAAEPGLRVLLLDRADFPRDKCCGDGIAPHVLDVLRTVGAGHVVDGWTPLEQLELSREDRSVTGRMARPVWVVPREVFDARLVEAAVAAGAVLRRHRVRTLAAHAGGTLVDDHLLARVLVGADGAHSVVRTHLGEPNAGRRALALRGYAPTPDSRRGRQVIRYGDRRQPSYAWAFDRGDGLSNVGYGEFVDDHAGPDDEGVTRAILLEQLERLLPGSTEGGTQWRAHHLPLSGWRWDQPDGAVLLAGDAAGLINPMTGEGIYYAVATGVLAGRTAARVLAADEPEQAGRAHRAAVRSLLGRHLHHTWLASRLTRRPEVVDAGIGAAGRSRHAFDALVELGLGDGRITPRLAAGLATELVRGTRPTSSTRPTTRTPRR
ncbi:geranylgeranyl reductase family protein [Nocardioides sp. KIGAM211]|uniref:Geranylgeranyl reductase family protein n=1 Tax=Nocardioides luti TaxID=2761101 RepID=A0A7X0RHK2_9ACTN|nr:geranylgeranyl reductase family protein [Nocardioides luti]MBB6628322.1 geranylgeranyl reductase family protein [Nocardioides luti]